MQTRTEGVGNNTSLVINDLHALPIGNSGVQGNWFLFQPSGMVVVGFTSSTQPTRLESTISFQDKMK